MIPSQLENYTRKCYRNGCNGEITVTKEIGQHLFIETNINTYKQQQELQCYIKDIAENIKVEQYT